jgi:hypothetical protein
MYEKAGIPSPDVPEGMTREQIDALEAGFQAGRGRLSLCVILVALTFLFVVHAAMAFGNEALANADGHEGFRVLGQPALWWIFPAFGAWTLSFEITLQIWALFAGRRIVDLYTAWDARQPKRTRSGGVNYYDTRQGLRLFALGLALPIGIGTMLALNMHTTVGDDAMRVYGYAFTSPEVYSYIEVRRVTVVQGHTGKHGFVEHPYVVVDFTKRRRWRESNNLPRSVATTLSTLLCEKTGLTAAHARLISDIPALGGD